MAARKFELWLGYLGNGVTVCNQAVLENNDYKHIAHISNNGILKLYVKEDYIPKRDMKRIRQTAENMKVKFLITWNKYTDSYKYMYLLDNTPALFDGIQGETLAEKVKYLENKYLFSVEL